MAHVTPRTVAVAAAALLVFGGSSAGSDQRPFSVALVLSPGSSSSPYDASALAGLRAAVRDLGVKATVRQPGPKEGYLPTFLDLARRGYDLVIAGSGLQFEPLDLAAVEYPDVQFAILDVSQKDLPHRPRNALGITFASQESAYLAGYLAGKMERRRPGRDVVSSVGGLKAPPVDDFIAGYQAGARRASPHVVTLNSYVQSFADTARCRSAAVAQIARGSGVVFPVAGACGFGALQAAKKEGVWGVGVDADQASLGPHVLTSVVKRVDVALYTVIRRAVRGSVLSGTVELGLREKGVRLGKISPKVPHAIVAQVEHMRLLIVAGKIQIPTKVR